MNNRGLVFGIVIIFCFFGGAGPLLAQHPKDGEGLSSQNLWSTPGNSNFAFVQSSDVLAHKNSAFSVIADFYRKPLGLQIGDKVNWSVQRVTALDFSWAIGLFDRFQLGLVLPVHIEQAGVGSSPLNMDNDPGNTTPIGSTAINDLRLHGKTQFYQQYPERELRGVGIAVDMGLSIPTGDEKNFAGEKGIVWAPSFLLDLRQRWISLGANAGVRLRSGPKAGLADSTVGNQFSSGLGVTVHLLDDALLLGVETTLLAEIDNFEHLGMEMRGSVGSRPDVTQSIALWLTASAGFANDEEPLLCTPQMRFTFGLTYTPSKKAAATDIFF